MCRRNSRAVRLSAVRRGLPDLRTQLLPIDYRRRLDRSRHRTETPTACPCNCAFQAVRWCGFTSNSLADSAKVFSPLMAANAALP